MKTPIKRKEKPTQIDIYVGSKIRVYRTMQGMSQNKLAEELGVSFQQVQKYENGTNRVSAGRLYNISKALNVDITKFYGEYANEPAMNDNLILMADKDTIEIARIFSQIENKGLKSNLLRLMKNYLGEKDNE